MDANIQKYMAFVKAVECGSFTKAARLLSYSQSGISRMIHDLENEWNVTLLDRSKSGVTLTSDGLTLLPYAQNICHAYQDLQMQLSAQNELHSGCIRIGTFSSVATHWLPNIIKQFQMDYPGIDYELLLGDYSEIEQWILSGRVDCGFLRLPVCDKLDAAFLEQDRLMVVLPENHPLSSCDRFPITAICDSPFLLLEKGEKAGISELFKTHNLSPDIHFTTWDDYAIMAMVESGLGISVLPELILRRTPYHIVTKELDVPAYRRICIATHGKQNASFAVKKFMEYLDYRNG